MMFVTVGSALPLDRLVRAVDDALANGLIEEDVFAQIGAGSYEPRHARFERFLDKAQYDTQIQTATSIVGHAGIGTIAAALAHNKPILVMPRLKEYGELVNDHQLATARKFAAAGHVLAAYHVGEIPSKLQELKLFVPRPRVARPELVSTRIGRFLDEMASGRR